MPDPFRHRRSALSMLQIDKDKLAVDIEAGGLLDAPQFPDFMKIPEGGFKAGELVPLIAALGNGEPKSNLALYSLLRHAQENPDKPIINAAPPGIGRGLLEPIIHLEPNITIDSIAEYNSDRTNGKLPTVIVPEEVLAGTKVKIGYQTVGGQPPKHKAKKGGGKKKVRVSPLLKNLLKGLGK